MTRISSTAVPQEAVAPPSSVAPPPAVAPPAAVAPPPAVTSESHHGAGASVFDSSRSPTCTLHSERDGFFSEFFSLQGLEMAALAGKTFMEALKMASFVVTS